MTAAAANCVSRSELEGDLTNARHLTVLVQWIGVARDFIEGMQRLAEVRPGLTDELRAVGVYIHEPDWGECEGNALRHLHQRIEGSIRDVERMVGLGDGGAR